MIQTPTSHHTPTRSRRRTRYRPRGRPVDAHALQEVSRLLTGIGRERHRLVENLHLIQDHHGYLSERHLAALAQVMDLSLAQVYETASFYAQFIIVPDDEPAPPPVVLRVCDGLPCMLNGSAALLDAARKRFGERALVLHEPCMGRCERAPVASLNQHHLGNATADAIGALIDAGDYPVTIPDYPDLDRYIQQGGYRLLETCLEGARTSNEIITILSNARLRGLGGAGYPAGRKWASLASLPKPKYVAVNFDESEVGTYKDRYFTERDPHRLLEGILIAAWAIGAGKAYIYLRDEYHHIREILQREIANLDAARLTQHCHISLVRGAGAYVCGERSAMIESIEGKRGEPRIKYPRTSMVGLFDIPTLINNAETLYWVRDIVERGAEWFSAQGRNGRSGFRAFSVSGRVREPGVKEAAAGITMNQLLEEYCGGMQEGHRFKGYCLGGSSGGILPASMADIPLDFDTLEAYDCSIGSAAITVFSHQDPIRDIVRNLALFFAEESCGQCTPCRVGTEKVVKLIEQDRWDEALLEDLCEVMDSASICGLGQAAPAPVRSALRYFRTELGLPPKSGEVASRAQGDLCHE